MAKWDAGTLATTRGRLIVLFAVLALVAPGCKSWQSFKARTATIRNALLDSSYEDPRPAAQMAAACPLLTDGKYAKAFDGYRELADNQGNPTDLAERARFMQAECRRMRGQYPEAVDTYQKMLQDFPTGPHRREACQRMYEVA